MHSCKVTAIYGINIPTPRTIFLRHEDLYCSGGPTTKLKSAYKIDNAGEVRGLKVVDGIGYETVEVAQRRPDTGEIVKLSGDGTVPYYSLRAPAMWHQAATCEVMSHEVLECALTVIESEVSIHELPGCDHPGHHTMPCTMP